MVEEKFIERYRQRYETWRHLDRIRYQIVQLTIAFVGAIGFLAQANGNTFPFWMIFILGVTFYFLGRVLAKVNDAIVANGAALCEYGKLVGDDKIPEVSKRTKSIFYYLEYLLSGFGMFLFFWGVLVVIGDLK